MSHIQLDPASIASFPRPKSIIDIEYTTLYLKRGQILPHNRHEAKNDDTSPAFFYVPLENDLYFHIHLSGVVVLGLAQHHPIIENKYNIINIKWNVLESSGGKDGPNNNGRRGKGNNNDGVLKVSGKRKHGAPRLRKNHTLCTIKCENGQEYYIKPQIQGDLVEINPLLLTQSPQEQSNNNNKNTKKNPNKTEEIAPSVTDYNILWEEPKHRGFMCLFLLKPDQMQSMLQLFLSPTQYTQYSEFLSTFTPSTQFQDDFTQNSIIPFMKGQISTILSQKIDLNDNIKNIPIKLPTFPKSIPHVPTISNLVQSTTITSSSEFIEVKNE